MKPTPAYSRCSEYSQSTLDELRARLAKLPLGDRVVLVCGSYARRDASESSDIDFFILSSDTNGSSSPLDEVRGVIKEAVPNEPSENGAFGGGVNRGTLLGNIGGDDDTNQNMTRRILFLLEGEWLYNPEGLRDFRREILERYIREDMSDHQLALFLLNDVIRYYRTVAVDYEFKIAKGKAWGIRNVKLVFSRKLLYASGLFSVAMTAGRTREDKIRILEDLFELPVVERMIAICGRSRMEAVLDGYNLFLEKLEDPDTRERLINLGTSERSYPLFRDLKHEGHLFTRELLKLFENTFDSTHPIHWAVRF